MVAQSISALGKQGQERKFQDHPQLLSELEANLRDLFERSPLKIKLTKITTMQENQAEVYTVNR